MQTPGDLIILYIEDDLRSREILELLLNNVMHISHYFVFENSLDFAARFEALPLRPQLLLVDIQIEPYNGYEILKMVRQTPDGNSLKIIALTASVTVQEVQTLKRAGFNGLIGKPIKGRIFPELIKKIVKGDPVWLV